MLDVPGALTGSEGLRIEASVVRKCSLGGPSFIASLIFHLDRVTQARLDALPSALELGPPKLETIGKTLWSLGRLPRLIRTGDATVRLP